MENMHQKIYIYKLILSNLDDTAIALFNKWIIYVLVLNNSNLQNFFKYKLPCFQLKKGSQWPSNLRWCMVI